MHCHAFNRRRGRGDNSVFPSPAHTSTCARVIIGNRADHWNNFRPFLKICKFAQYRENIRKHGEGL